MSDVVWPPPRSAVSESGILGRNLGFLTSLTYFRPSAEVMPWWLCSGALARTPPGHLFSEDGGAASAGTSLSFQEAVFRALGEAFERYSALAAPIITRPAPFPPGMAFARCAVQEPCADELKATPVGAELMSVPVTRLTNGESIWLPAEFVHLSYWGHGQPMSAVPISTGLAFGPSTVNAVWRGLCEVAERDALMTLWWTRTGFSEIDMHHAAAYSEIGERIRLAAAAGISVRVFQMSSDFSVPAVFCLMECDRSPQFAVGACCREDPVKAICKAIDEAVSGRFYVLSLERTEHAWRDRIPQRAEDVHSLEDHILYYSEDEHAAAFDFLNGAPVTSLEDFCQDGGWPAPVDDLALAELAFKLEGLGLDVFWTDLTAPEIASFGRVVKVVVPQMVPLSPEHSTRWLASPRITTAMARANLELKMLNPYPHPFA